MISTRGQYALRVLVDLAELSSDGFVPLKELAETEGISLKYLEKIMTELAKNELVESVHGRGGGYKLAREPKDYSIGEILRLTEGDLAPVACVGKSHACERADKCRTFPLWDRGNKLVNDFYDSVSLADLMQSGDKE